MQNKTNDERLKILQERLAQLKKKDDNPVAPTINKISIQETTHNQQPENSIKNEEPKWGLEEKKPKSFRWIMYVIIIALIAFVTTQEAWKWDFSEILGYKNNSTKEVEITIPEDNFVLTYNLDMEGDNIAITASLIDESSAKALVNDLIIKGFQSDYFFLPNKSNSTEEVYKVFIGPYENLQETNQWCKNIKEEFNIVNL